VDYGKASAGGRTIDDPCEGQFDIGFGCGGGDGEAWFQAGVLWSAFVATLDTQAQKIAPPETWPPAVTLLAPQAKIAREVFSQPEPWIAGKGVILSWAGNQQDLRNYASALATFLEGQGVVVPVKGPADVPPIPSTTSSIIKMVGLLGAGYLAIQLFKASKD
jgi:hypothetical protein